MAALNSSACGAGGSAAGPSWHIVTPGLPVGEAGSVAFPDAVEPAGGGQPWLIGGVIVTPHPATAEGLVVTNQTRRVAIWEAPAPRGRWNLATMNAVPGRDGPFETILYFARRGAAAIAFGSRVSPTEGYPRPSAWSKQVGSWQEELEPRELFGGPNIVAFGGMAAGPHGFFIAGTWSDRHGHAEASVWESGNGSTWTRISDPSFEGRPGETPFGEEVADTGNGSLLIATIEAPTPENPAAERGGAWYSPEGGSWLRVDTPAEVRTTFGAVIGTPHGWIIGGSVGSVGNQRAAVWTIDSRHSISAARVLPGRAARSATVTSMWLSGARVTVAGVEDGRPGLWSGMLNRGGVPTAWSQIRVPPVSVPDLLRVVGTSNGDAALIVLIGKESSEVWRS